MKKGHDKVCHNDILNTRKTVVKHAQQNLAEHNRKRQDRTGPRKHGNNLFNVLNKTVMTKHLNALS